MHTHTAQRRRRMIIALIAVLGLAAFAFTARQPGSSTLRLAAAVQAASGPAPAPVVIPAGDTMPPYVGTSTAVTNSAVPDATCTGSYDYYPDVAGYALEEVVHVALLRIISSGYGHYEICDFGNIAGTEAYYIEDTQNGLCLNNPESGYGQDVVGTSCPTSDSQTSEAWYWYTSSDGSGTYWFVNVYWSSVDGANRYLTANGTPAQCGQNGAGVYDFPGGHGDCAIWLSS
jgi:hypothetical protein